MLDIPDADVHATRLNVQHSYQLASADKRHLARLFYEQGRPADDIAGVLSVGRTTVFTWTDDLKQEAKERQKQQVLELYLACKSYREIEQITGIPEQTVSRWLGDLTQKYKTELLGQPLDSLQPFNLWSFQRPDPRYGLDYPGRIPDRIDAIHRLRGAAIGWRSGR